MFNGGKHINELIIQLINVITHEYICEQVEVGAPTKKMRVILDVSNIFDKELIFWLIF